MAKSTAAAKKTSPKTNGASAKSTSAWNKREKNLRKSFPELTDNDLHRYAGEEDESILRRVAEKTGKTYDEVVSVAGE